MAPIVVGLILALSAGSGAAFAAEGSLPGDTLYPLKIHITEEVQSAFAFSDEAHARVDALHAERRLEEVARLSAEGRLNAEVRAGLETRLESHLKSAEAHVAKMKMRGEKEHVADVEAGIESSLSSYRDVLQDLNEESGGKDVEVRGILHAISVRATEATGRRIKAIADIELEASSTLPQITAQHDAAVSALARAEVAHTASESTLSAERNARITLELSAAHDAIARGDKEVLDKTYAQAFVSYYEAFRLSVFVESMVRASGHVESSQRREGSKSQDTSRDTPDEPTAPPAQKEGRQGVQDDIDVRIDRETRDGDGNSHVELGGSGTIRLPL